MSRSFEKKAVPVSMSKLLSHGYVEEKKKSPNDDDSSSRMIVMMMIIVMKKMRVVMMVMGMRLVVLMLTVGLSSRCDLGTDQHRGH